MIYKVSIKGYRIVTMQNTVGKLLEKIVARRLAIQLEEDNFLTATLGSYRRGRTLELTLQYLPQMSMMRLRERRKHSS